MLKSILLSFVFFFNLPPNSLIQVDFADEIAVQFKQGNAKEIAKLFSSSVELIVIDQEDVYNRVQAEQILKDFFLKYPASKTSVLHRLSNNPNYRLAVFSYFAKNDKFRITTTFKKSSNVFLITELRIELDR